ncbi:MAG: phosphoribosylaminoimidazolesuccinocarboxamide synthase [Bacteroidetes bacterium]|nr:phosphoribosylaminoimidazolesuccinocarboxamide synthase [Bacteroidota bacterium]MBP6649996.1 phosphoribosylaminoimidazolesuccinocarboxamide synthase [Bacteroidia bacterium]
MSKTVNSVADAIQETKFKFPGQTAYYKGKVRDVYTIDETYLVMVVTDRISAFDVVLPRAIPFKGQVLNEIAAYMLNATKDVVPNWVIDVPDPNVTIGRMCTPYKVEMVIRGYLSGHAWREYSNGNRVLCGVRMPDGMKENDKFPKPIITPTTKASFGHDMDISADQIIQQGIVSAGEYDQLENYTRAVYQRGSELAAKRGLILVDTKYEFGKSGDQIFLIDEIHTPDSSRYFYAEGYEDRQQKGQPQKQLSKEFVRQWLIENNFQGKEGQVVPEMQDEWVEQISRRYIELYEKLIGDSFVKQDTNNQLGRIEENILNSLAKNKKN